MRTRPRGRSPESVGPAAPRGADAVDRYLIALDLSVDAPSLAALEHEFVRYAKHFSECQGVSFAAWCDVGVPRHVLERAGIPEVPVG